MTQEANRDFVYEIKEQIGAIKTFPNGWSKELNIVQWNDGPPKYDIREWDAEHEHMSRGITLHTDEMQAVVDLLRDRAF